MVLTKVIDFLKNIFLSDWVILVYFILAFLLGFWLYSETEDEYKAKGKWIFYFFAAYVVFIGLYLNYYLLFLFLVCALVLRLKGFRFYGEIGSIFLGTLLGVMYNPNAGWLVLFIPIPLVYSNLICDGMDKKSKAVNVILFGLSLVVFSLMPIKF